jgi:hypothetical protein
LDIGSLLTACQAVGWVLAGVPWPAFEAYHRGAWWPGLVLGSSLVFFVFVPGEVFLDGFPDDPGDIAVLRRGVSGEPFLELGFDSYGWKGGVPHRD